MQGSLDYDYFGIRHFWVHSNASASYSTSDKHNGKSLLQSPQGLQFMSNIGSDIYHLCLEFCTCRVACHLTGCSVIRLVRRRSCAHTNNEIYYLCFSGPWMAVLSLWGPESDLGLGDLVCVVRPFYMLDICTTASSGWPCLPSTMIRADFKINLKHTQSTLACNPIVAQAQSMKV